MRIFYKSFMQNTLHKLQYLYTGNMLIKYMKTALILRHFIKEICLFHVKKSGTYGKLFQDWVKKKKVWCGKIENAGTGLKHKKQNVFFCKFSVISTLLNIDSHKYVNMCAFMRIWYFYFFRILFKLHNACNNNKCKRFKKSCYL